MAVGVSKADLIGRSNILRWGDDNGRSADILSIALLARWRLKLEKRL
jgi:hypothetical protein